jgi:hypothetical protein
MFRLNNPAPKRYTALITFSFVLLTRPASDWPGLLADLDGASNPVPFSDSSLPLSERSEFGQALKKEPNSRKQAIVGGRQGKPITP